MAKLGVRTIDEMVGRTDLLKVRENPQSKRGRMIDLGAILNSPYMGKGNLKGEYQFGLSGTLDQTVLIKELQEKLDAGEPGKIQVHVKNTDRTFGTMFGSELTISGRGAGNTYQIACTGNGGQSFGAFIPAGLTIRLDGDCNDYFGKGLSGGKLVIRPPKGSLPGQRTI